MIGSELEQNGWQQGPLFSDADATLVCTNMDVAINEPFVLIVASQSCDIANNNLELPRDGVSLLVVLVFLAAEYEQQRDQTALEADATGVVSDIRSGLLRNVQTLQSLYSVAPTADSWTAPAADLLTAHREMVRLEWRSNTHALLAHRDTPYLASLSGYLNRDQALPDVRQACATAGRYNTPSYSQSYFWPIPQGYLDVRIAAAVIATGAFGTTAALAWGGHCDGPRGGKSGWSQMAPEQMKAKMTPLRVVSADKAMVPGRRLSHRDTSVRYNRQFRLRSASAFALAISRKALASSAGGWAPLTAYCWSKMKKGTPLTPICLAASTSERTC